MDGQSLLNERAAKDKEMVDAVANIRKWGAILALSEEKYKTQLRATMLYLRGEKYPSNLVPDLARGDQRVAELRKERDNNEVMYKAAIDALNVKKLQYKSIEADMEAIRRTI